MQSQSQSDQHLSEEALEIYSAGSMPEEECTSLEEHLLTCPHCQTRLTETDDYLRATRAAASDLRRATRRPSKDTRERRLWPLAAAGLVACAVAIVLPWRSNQLQHVRDIDLTVERGAGQRSVIQAPVGQRLALNLDLTEVQHAQEYRLEVVNASGAQVWAGLVKKSGSRLRAELPVTLAQGIYWVRLYIPTPAPLLLREYGLQVL